MRADDTEVRGQDPTESSLSLYFQAGNDQTLLSTQVDQLIQAMAVITALNGGITWHQAIDQDPQGVQTVLAANGWQ